MANPCVQGGTTTCQARVSMLNHFQHDGTLGGRAQGQTETSTTLEGVPVRGATGGIEDPDMMVTTIPGNATPTTAMTEPSVGEHEELHSGKQQPLPNINEHPLVMPDPLLTLMTPPPNLMPT